VPGRINYEQFLNGITQMTQLQCSTTTHVETTTTKTKDNNFNQYNYEPDRNSNGVSKNFMLT
jgi:hypothetical protein